jgi:hypothetical protein
MLSYHAEGKIVQPMHQLPLATLLLLNNGQHKGKHAHMCHRVRGPQMQTN